MLGRTPKSLVHPDLVVRRKEAPMPQVAESKPYRVRILPESCRGYNDGTLTVFRQGDEPWITESLYRSFKHMGWVTLLEGPDGPAEQPTGDAGGESPTGDPPEDDAQELDLSKMGREALEAEAERRNLTIEEGSGAGGNVLVEDLREAIRADIESAATDDPPTLAEDSDTE